MDNILYIDEKDEENNNVEFVREMHVVTNLAGEVIDTYPADFVVIRCPGDTTNIVKTIATDIHKARFPRLWAAYCGMIESANIGTPIDQWDILPGMIDVFKSFGFSTIDQVARASENALNRIQGGQGWKIKAKAFLDRSVVPESTRLQKLESENAEMKAKLEMLLKDNADNLDDSSETAVKMRGRPPKSA